MFFFVNTSPIGDSGSIPDRLGFLVRITFAALR